MDLKELTANVHQLIPILGAMQIEAVECDGGRVSARMPAAPNVNHFGAAYAGSLFSVGEVLGGLVGWSALAMEGFVPIAKRLEVDFRRPATTAVTATAELSDEEITRVRAEAEANGKSDFELHAELTDAEGTVVARTHGYYQLRKM